MNLRFETRRVCSPREEKTQKRSLDKQKAEGWRSICLLHPSLASPLCRLLICKAKWQMVPCHRVRAA